MPRPYRAPNKRIQFRGGGGRFRRSTLGDVGLGECDRCGKFFAPNLSGLEGPFVDPRDFNARRRTCGPCLGLPEPPPQPKPPGLMETLDRWFADESTNDATPPPA
jgi:hypothetical protein